MTGIEKENVQQVGADLAGTQAPFSAAVARSQNRTAVTNRPAMLRVNKKDTEK